MENPLEKPACAQTKFGDMLKACLATETRAKTSHCIQSRKKQQLRGNGYASKPCKPETRNPKPYTELPT